ncbi:MAG: alkane 1-monooxygenase [Methylococcaceae bacterium]
MKALPFLLPYLVSSTMIVGYTTNQLWLFRVVGWAWLIVAMFDLANCPETQNSHNQQVSYSSWDIALGRFAVRLWMPVQATIIVCGLSITTWDYLTVEELLIVTVSVGIASGMFCIPVAHELMHKRGRFDKILAEILMTSVSYTHFCIEHIHGHHRNVGTADDPATAQFGESFYAFYPRTVFGGIVSAWNFEKVRLYRLGASACSPRNRMIRYGTSLSIVYAMIFSMFGLLGVGFFAVQSVIAFSMLEAVNYIEHYGLTRREMAPGCYERVMPCHSWDSNHLMSNWMLFNLGRHSDHHYRPTKNYLYLHQWEEAPQLPGGYFMMYLLPLVPPLWRRIMDSGVQAWRRKHGFVSNADS